MKIFHISLSMACVGLVVILIGKATSFEKPEELTPQVILPATVVGIHDGDTIKVRIEQVLSIRLKDVWSDELSEKNGQASLENLQKICPIDSKVLLQVPLETDISKMFTFGRVLGNVYKDGQDIGERQIRDGFATKNKPKKVKG